MKEIPFIQYLLPNGRRTETGIERPEDIYDKAQEIIKAGYRFEAEVLTNGMVSLAISDDEKDHDIELVSNGPDVPLAADRMINRFYDKRIAKGRAL